MLMQSTYPFRPFFIAMAGLFCIACTPSGQTDRKIETVKSTPDSSLNLEQISHKMPEYNILGYVSPKDIGLSLGMKSSHVKQVLKGQGFNYFDMLGVAPVYGKCAGVAEILSYYKAEQITGRKVIVTFDADFRSDMRDGECKRILYSLSLITIKEEK